MQEGVFVTFPISSPLCRQIHTFDSVVLAFMGQAYIGMLSSRVVRPRVLSFWLGRLRLATCLSLAPLPRGPSNLVDPASSHMLVSKIKPCMCQCKLQHGQTVNGSLQQL